ncbi:MAG TPA: hypothetical protein VGF99_09175, partial [Myxococcota bacterium]
LPLALNTSLRMIEATSADEDIAVDVVGSTVDGEKHWDFTGPYEGDANITVQAHELSDDLWFNERVQDLELDASAGQIYASLLSADTWGVFQRTADKLLIHVVAAVDEDVGNFIAYDPPIQALAYPLSVGTTWSSESTGDGDFEVSGFLSPYCSTDTYTSAVTDRGVVTTPAGDYDVLRVETTQNVVVENCFNPFLTAAVTYKQVIFVTACTGAVVTVTSDEGAEDFSFEVASRLRRVGL